MILENWIKCCAGEIQYARKNEPYNVEATEQDVENWDRLFSEYLDKFGLNDLYRQLLNVQVKLAKRQNDYILTKDKKLKNEIRIFESDIEKLKSKMSGGISTEKVLIYLSKWFGNGMLRAKDITVVEYLTLIEEYERANKKE